MYKNDNFPKGFLRMCQVLRICNSKVEIKKVVRQEDDSIFEVQDCQPTFAVQLHKMVDWKRQVGHVEQTQ